VTIAYQSKFSSMIGVPYAYPFWKGRVALYAILQALGIGPGDEVILPGFTCVVVPNSIRFAGATPVFVDIDVETFNVDAATLHAAITPRTRAVLVQHTFGIPVDMTPVLELTQRYGLPVIEDCAHSLGSTYRGQQVGTFGAAAFFSSQWSKPYTTGIGGMAVTSDKDIAERLEKVYAGFSSPKFTHVMRLALQYFMYSRLFSSRSYWTAMGLLRNLSRWKLFVGSSDEMEIEGHRPLDLCWKMSSFQAYVGRRCVRSVSGMAGHRRALSDRYARALEDRGWHTVKGPPQSSINWLRYPVRVINKAELLQRARIERIELGSWFESVLHPVRTGLDRFGYRLGQCPVAEQVASEIVNLPLHSRVSLDESQRIVDFVLQFGKAYERPYVHKNHRVPSVPSAFASASMSRNGQNNSGMH
jgi:perosamine synthetase